MQSLALAYRPATFADLVGQRAVQVILAQMVTRGAVPTALIFDGGHGTGKTTTARILAAALNCEAGPGAAPPPCAACVSCKAVADGTSLDVVEIDAASNGLVDDIRALRSQIQYAVGGRTRVVILDEAHSMSSAAFNALLKTLEEPPPATVFVLLTTEPGRIPDTVASRCTPFTFRHIAVADITARLHHICATERFTVEPELLTLLAERANGSLRDAVMALDQLTRGGIITVAAYTDLMGATDPGPALLAAIAAGAGTGYAAVAAQLDTSGDARAVADALATTLRDVLILHAGGTPTRQGEALAQRQRLAERVDAGQALAALRVLWELKTRFRGVEDPRTGLDLAVALLTEVVGRRAGPAATATPAPAARLTLAEMAALAVGPAGGGRA